MNSAIASEMAARVVRRTAASSDSVPGLKANDAAWATRDVCAWEDGRELSLCTAGTSFSLSSNVPQDFTGLVRDGEHLYLRSSKTLKPAGHSLTVISSEPLDKTLLGKLASGVGEITLYSSGFEVSPAQRPPAPVSAGKETAGKQNDANLELHATATAGNLAAPSGTFDRMITFGTPLPVTDWETGNPGSTAALRIQTRPSILYTRLFAALGDFAKSVQYVLITIAVIFAIIELLALFIGTRLTRTVTRAVAQLYVATHHINRGDFSHRIPVKSHDQFATLESSFNSMTARWSRSLTNRRRSSAWTTIWPSRRKFKTSYFPADWRKSRDLRDWNCTAYAAPLAPSAATTMISCLSVPTSCSLLSGT